MGPALKLIATALPRPETLTGVDRFVVVPSPSWPWMLSPQQRTVPATSAQVSSRPAAIAAAFVRPETLTGVGRLVVVPSPSSPEPLSPQQRTVPSASRA